MIDFSWNDPIYLMIIASLLSADKDKIEELKKQWNEYKDDILSNYNIITAPKTIKLSEIVSKLNEIFNDTEFSSEIYFNRKLNAIGEGEYDKDWFMNTWTPFIRFKENKISEIVKSGNERTKWLYTLWIAGTIIEDDLKEEE